MKKHLSILLIEDNESDAFLCLYHLEKAGFEVTSQRVETADEIKDALSIKKFDIILSDSYLPNLNIQNIFEIYKSYKINTPFILISGVIDEESIEGILKIGIDNYIMKNNLNKLGFVVKNALQEKKES